MLRVLNALLATACALALLLTCKAHLREGQAPDRVVVAPPLAGAGQVRALAEPGVLGQAPVGEAVPARRAEVTGPVVRWATGQVQVRATLAGSRIVAVRAVRLAADNPVSRHRSTVAVRRLDSAVLSSQRADVDAVSGATFTSEAYLRSLQAALDTARAHG